MFNKILDGKKSVEFAMNIEVKENSLVIFSSICSLILNKTYTHYDLEMIGYNRLLYEMGHFS